MRHRLVGRCSGPGGCWFASWFWAWHAMQPAYDREQARVTLLGMRYQLFLANPPSRINLHLAVTAPDKYPGLPEADLVKALAMSATGDKGVALKFLNDKLRQQPDQWLYRALRSEIGVVKDPDVALGFDRLGPGGSRPESG